MAQAICLMHQFLGLTTRVECVARALPDETGRWVLLFASGLSVGQPSIVQAQGPFYGGSPAREMLASVIKNLLQMGYQQTDEPAIWGVHFQAEVRRLGTGLRHLA